MVTGGASGSVLSYMTLRRYAEPTTVITRIKTAVNREITVLMLVYSRVNTHRRKASDLQSQSDFWQVC